MALPQTIVAWWSRSPGARGLAFLRMLVGVVVLGSADVWRAPLLVAPTYDAGVVAALRIVVLISAALTLIGLATRWSSLLLAASSLALLGLIQTQGTPIHVQHLAWLAVLVAVGPSGAALSVDSWWLPPASDDVADAAETTVRWACVVLALVYFFPGVHKLIAEASPFTDGDALARLVRLKALEAGVEVPLHLDQRPTLLVVGGATMIAAEVAVVCAALTRPRVGVALVGLIHLAIFVVLRMPYSVLAIFAVVFLLPRSRGVRPLGAARAPSIAGAVLVMGITWAGARGDIAGYPFACYPTFALPVPLSIRVVDVAVAHADGSFADLPHEVVVPDDIRTPVSFAERRVTSRAEAERFVAWRMSDARFRSAVAGATQIRVTSRLRSLANAQAVDVETLVFLIEAVAAE